MLRQKGVEIMNQEQEPQPDILPADLMASFNDIFWRIYEILDVDTHRSMGEPPVCCWTNRSLGSAQK